MIFKKLFTTVNFILSHPLNHKKKLVAVRRWLFWQIGSRLVPGSVVIPFVNGTKLLVKTGMTGATGNIYCGLHEFESMGFALHLLRPEDLFLDVGANIGSYSILAASRGARSLSFEPVKKTGEHFIDNIRLNRFENLIDIVNVAVSNTTGTVKISTELDTINHIVPQGGASVQIETALIECDTLNHLAADLKPVLIKIDVEGHEPQVLEGADEVIKKETLLAVILEVNSEQAHKKMMGFGFKPYHYLPLGRCLRPLLSFNVGSPNTLYVRDIESVKSRLISAPRFVVLDQAV